MMVIRPVALTDLNDIVVLASQTGTGLTTLPNNPAHLEEKIRQSLRAFDKTTFPPLDETYLFVLEDTSNSKVVGTSGIVAAVGTTKPFYTYKINQEVHFSETTNVYKDHQFLTLTNDFTGDAEICTLFLSPEHRGGGNGQLLSKSRFLFMADHHERFGQNVVAEMRGQSDDQGHSPLWESLGRHFFDMDFAEADKENGQGNSQFIAELIPHHPIYINLLSKEAQDILGMVHPDTRPAEQMLIAEGFRYTGYIDIFDGGPTIESPVSNVKTVRESLLYPIKTGTLEGKEIRKAMLSNRQLKNYRACLAQVAVDDEYVVLSNEMAINLQVSEGDTIRVKFAD
ncbi:MAG: arginine N-succinyltransferase [Gammaproteobacteria bacterium]|nr:arginine N-succinyltransferase [Gammaproteobacteria bacterium]MDH5630099.1 arginine N-succinyltransferase [Gammaproteobacteria bacterium]